MIHDFALSCLAAREEFNFALTHVTDVISSIGQRFYGDPITRALARQMSLSWRVVEKPLNGSGVVLELPPKNCQ